MRTDTSNTVALCGSMKAMNEMIRCSRELEHMGIVTYLPNPDELKAYAMSPANERAITKAKLIRDHLEKIISADAVLICNTTLDERINYIGANSFLEMGFAFAFGKPIYLLTDIPNQSNSDEIAGLLPICLNRDLEQIRRQVHSGMA